MILHSPTIYHLGYAHKGNWKEEIYTVEDCIAVIHADEVTIEDINNVMQTLKDKNIRLAIEPARRGDANRSRPNCTLAEIEHLLSSSDPAYIGICYDTAHGQIAGEPIGELAKYKDRLFLMHFCDSQGVRCGRPIGSGDVDLPGVMKFLREEINFYLPIIYEVGRAKDWSC